MISSHNLALRTRMAYAGVFCAILSPQPLQAQTWNCTIAYAGKMMRNDINLRLDATSVTIAKQRALAAAPPHANAAARIALCQQAIHSVDIWPVFAPLH